MRQLGRINGGTDGTARLSVGGLVQAVGQFGTAKLTFGNGTASTTVGGNLIVAGFTSVTLAAGRRTPSAAASLFRHNVATGNSIILADNFTIGKDLTYTGGIRADTVSVGSIAVLGNLALNLGDGNNAVTAPLTSTVFTVSGNYSIAAGSGNNTLAVSVNGNGGSSGGLLPTVQGDWNIHLGDGNNTIFGPGQFFSVGGNMNVTAGNGNNTQANPIIDPFVSGNLSMNLGNGTNSFELAVAPVGKFTWRSGNGSDTLTLGDNGSFTGGGLFGVPATR